MRVYLKKDGKLVLIEDLKKLHTSVYESIYVLMHEKMKYQLMWELRSLEEEIKLSGGHILLTIDKLENPPSINGEGFSEDLLAKIRTLALNVVF